MLHKQIDLRHIDIEQLIFQLMQNDSLGKIICWRSKNDGLLTIGIGEMENGDAELEDEHVYFSTRTFENSTKTSDIHIPKTIISIIEDKAYLSNQCQNEDHTELVLKTIALPKTDKKIIDKINCSALHTPEAELASWTKTFDETKELFQKSPIDKIVISRAKILKHTLSNLNEIIFWEPIRNNIQKNNQYFILIKFPHGAIHYSQSPETLIKKEGTKIYIDALAGTRKVSDIESENQHIAKELLNNKKEVKEHQLVENFIVSVLNANNIPWINNINKTVKRLKYVQHIFSQYSGKVDLGQWENLKSDLHPTPAVGARPYQYWTKISSLEANERGLYSGLIGHHRKNSEDICVNLRCFDMTKNCLKISAGCGVLPESEMIHEFIETERKMFNFTQYLDIRSLDKNNYEEGTYTENELY